MRTFYAGVAGAILLALGSIPASAAPISGAATRGVAASDLVQVRHDRRDIPLALWIWRCADGHCGYWHRNEHRWQDGWHKGGNKHRFARRHGHRH